MVYMRVDQVMIGTILTDTDVGIYSVAVRMSEVWYVIPMAIAQSVAPSIVAARKAQNGSYERRIAWLTAVLFWSSIGCAILITFCGRWGVAVLFGADYAEAGNVLQVHFWAGVFVSLGVASSQWLVAENKLRYSLLRTLTGLLVNLLLNLALIPVFGILGAAIATVISQACAVLGSLILFKRLHELRNIVFAGIIHPYKFLRRSFP